MRPPELVPAFAADPAFSAKTERGPLTAWALDESFLATAMARAASASLVSLDVFDTALTRTLDSPADAFAAIERRLLEQVGPAAAGYAQAREDAERAVRLRHARLWNTEEIDLAAILEELVARRPGLLASLRRLEATELAVEAGLLRAVPDILELTRRLRAAGKPFIFVSDMYLSADAIGGFLAANGYAGWQALHVSAATGATKAHGRQWQVIRHGMVPPPKILHIGDDPHADTELPRAHGIDTLPYVRARSERRLGFALTAAALPFSRARRDAVLRDRADPSRTFDPAAAWRRHGETLGAIVVGSFLRWLEQRVRLHGTERLYFCARDGWLMQRAWKAAGLDRATGIEDRYLLVSRRPLILARGALDSRPGHLDPALLAFASSSQGKISLGVALARIGCADAAEILDDLRRLGRSLEGQLVWPDGVAEFKALLGRHSALVHDRLCTARTEVASYLRQERLGDGRCGLVDMGWHGSLQRAMRAVVEAERGSTPLVGFYYGLWPAASGNRFRAGVMESAFASDFIRGDEQPEMHEAVEILEELHGAPHGSVRSYRHHEGSWQPVFAEDADELRQYETVTRHFQDGALQAVAALFATGRHGTLRLEDLTLDAARAALGAVCLSPTADELSLFGSLGHAASFDHARFEPLVPPVCPDDEAARVRALEGSGWRLGTLRAWHAGADDASRGALAELAKARLHLPARALRQFTG